MKKEIIRQSIHASGISFILIEPFFNINIIIFFSLVIVILAELIYRIDKKSYIPLFSKVLRGLRRDSKERGFVYYFVGVSLALILFNFNLNIANATILILSLGDAASTIIGKIYGKNFLPMSKQKTFEGSIAFFLVSLMAALTQLPSIPSFIGALTGSITEAYSPFEDNIAIPIISGIFMTLSTYLQHI
jgi:dolichol kinase